MKVSIVIPLYNKAPFVRRALDSIAAQTYPDFEVIVVDDGSTDEGASVVENYPDSRVRLLKQSNAGPGAARNAGIARAHGELIAFLDADDEWLPTYLEESVQLLERLGPQVASVTSGYIEYPPGISTESTWRKRGITMGINCVRPDMAPWLVVSMLAYMWPCSTVVRAEVLRKCGGFYDRERSLYGEDAHLFLKLLLNEEVAFNLHPLAKFHRDASGLSNNLSGMRPIEPFLKDPSEIEAACPPPLKGLLANFLAIRAAKTACVLGYWGHWREARSLLKRFTSVKNWNLPYHAPAVVCSTPIGSFLGTLWRALNKPLGCRTAHGPKRVTYRNQRGHLAKRQTSDSKIKLLDIIEATTINAVAKNAFEFHCSASKLGPDSPKIEFSLLTFDRGSDSNGTQNEFVVAARKLGLEIDVIPERTRFDLRVIRSLRKTVTSRAPDIILTNQVKSHFLLRLSGLSRRYHWVAFHHGYTATDRKTRLYNRLDRWSLPKADRVITVCQAFAKELESKGVPSERILVQHNSVRPHLPVSEEQVRQLRSRLGITKEHRVVLAVGRLSKEKAHIELVSAFVRLREICPNLLLRLIVVGEGPERGNLEAAVRSLGVTEQVVFAGQTNNVNTFYAVGNVLALSSHSEGSPYVLLEAMAANLPIVATSVGGVPEILKDDESALLVPTRDPQAMATAIARLLVDQPLARRLTTNAAALVTTRFSPETHARNLAQIYREVLNA